MVLTPVGFLWRIAAACFLSGISGHAGAQDLADKIETDRPDQTEASTVVPKGTVQLETGYLYQKDKEQERNIITQAYPTTTVRVGVLKWAEFRIIAALKDSVIENSSRQRVSGFGPLNLGTKIKLWSGAGWRPDAALIARVTLPTGTRGLSPDQAEPHFRLIFKNEITDKLALGYNFVYSWKGSGTVPAYTTAVSYELSEKFSCFGEVFGNKEEGETLQHQADAGMLFYALPNLQLDVAVGRNLTKNAPDFFMTAGLSVRLPR